MECLGKCTQTLSKFLLAFGRPTLCVLLVRFTCTFGFGVLFPSFIFYVLVPAFESCVWVLRFFLAFDLLSLPKYGEMYFFSFDPYVTFF